MMVPDQRTDIPPDQREPRFTDVEAREVLARAAERERAFGSSVSAAQLRDAALEAGISPAAFDDAVAEMGAAPARRRRSGLIATVIGFALLAGAAAGAVALRRDVAPMGSAPQTVQTTPAPIGEGEVSATAPELRATPMASSCGLPSGVPADRLRALASGLYPEVLDPANRHGSLVVALLFDAGCHVKAHVLTRGGGDHGVDEVLGPAFPAAQRGGWRASGIADVGPWPFEQGTPVIVWGVERESR